jgi:plastocyanin
MKTLLQWSGTPAANWNLLLQLAMGAALLVGMWLARRRRFGWHQACQTTVVALNLALTAVVMVPSFRIQRIASHALAHPGNGYYSIALIHALVGTVGIALAVWVVLGASTGLLPEALRLRRYKLWMRTTLAVWLAALGLGLLTYRIWYGVAAAAAPVPAPSAASEQPAQQPAETVVRLSNFKFTPPAVTVSAGATVTWLGDTGTHSVRCDEEPFDSGSLAGGQRYQHTFDHPGTYRIYCGVHGKSIMSSTITVTAK